MSSSRAQNVSGDASYARPSAIEVARQTYLNNQESHLISLNERQCLPVANEESSDIRSVSLQNRRIMTSPDMEAASSGWSPSPSTTLPVRSETINVPESTVYFAMSNTSPTNTNQRATSPTPYGSDSKVSSVVSRPTHRYSISSGTTRSHHHVQESERGTNRRLLYAQLMEDVENLKECRFEKGVRRSELQKRKEELRAHELKVLAREDRMLKKLTVAMLVHCEGYSKSDDQISLILELKSILQLRRDELRPIEHDCDRLEDTIAQLDLHIQDLERTIIQQVEDIMLIKPATQSAASRLLRSQGSMDFDGGDDDDDVEEEPINTSYHPLVEQYLSTQGDLDMVLERLAETLDERDNLEDQRAVRATVGLVLGEDEQEWLDGSEAEIKNLENQVDKLEIEVKALQESCFAKGLVDADGEPVELSAHEQTSFVSEEDLAAGSEVSEYTRYPTLLPQPLARHDEDEYGEVNVHDFKPTTGTRISEWLLNRLRDSALEVNLLARTYDMEAKGKESPAFWQVAVLKLWYKDDTVFNNACAGTVQTVSSHLMDDRPMSWHRFNIDSEHSQLLIGVRSLQLTTDN